MKKLVNGVSDYVNDMLDGIVEANPEVKRIHGTQVVVRTELTDKVALVSGGGSGHEPAHAGYVGKGMLDAAVSGEVFTSPTPDQVLAAIRAVDRGQGVLLIIKNYTGDVMNFEMAAEMAQAEGIQIESVVVDDDVAVDGSTYTVGRRGIAGTVFVHKIAGAVAERGSQLSEVKRIARKVIDNVRSMGMAVSPCTVPASGKPSFELEEDEIEIGMGIHGEPGTHRQKISNANEIVDMLLTKILNDGVASTGDEVAVMLNGLGATPMSELYILNKRVAEVLRNRGIKTYRTYVGEYMTSLEMAGFSISLLKIDEELKELLSDGTMALAWNH